MSTDSLDLALELERSSGLYQLWLDGSLTDCELVANDGTRWQAHKIVLAACSRFFRALFAGAWHASGPSQPAPHGGLPRWTLGGVDGPGLQLLLNAVYSKRLPLTAEGGTEEAAALLAAANYLEVLPVKEACCQLLRSRLSLASVAETLALAAAHDCAELAEEASRFFEGHFSQLLKSPAAASLALLPPDVLRQLLASDGLHVGSELDVARAALLWAAPAPEQRSPLLADLLPAARMTPAVLAEEAARCGLLRPGGGVCLAPADGSPAEPGTPQCSPPPSLCWQQAEQQQQEPWAEPDCPGLGRAFLDACQHLQQGSHAALRVGGGGSPAFRPRLSCPTGLILAGGLDDGWRPLRTVELYNPQRDCWEAGPLMPAACSFAAAAMLAGECVVVEGTAHAPAVLALDRHARRWRTCRGPATPRVNMAVAALEGKLFVLGGRAGIGKGAAVLREVEIFCPATDSWHAAPGMALPRASLAAAALGGRLYAVGGQDARATHASAEVFDPGAGRWLPLGSPLRHPRKYLGLAAAGGRLVAVGGMSGARLRLGAAEALDPREGRWQALPPMACPRSSVGVAALHGCVYVVGGNVGENTMQNHAGVEAWVPAAGRWRACAPISHGRSGMAVAPI